jgi:cytochrome c oxidase cbb3-type subunit III
MTRPAIFLAALLAFTSGCGTRNPADPAVIRPSKVMDFDSLYARNCSGCHGSDGKGGAAIGLGDPVYLTIADDAVIRRVTSEGVAGTPMPAFAQHFGGMLTGDQINVVVSGIRSRWAKPRGNPDAVSGAAVPPYSAPGPGDPKRGLTAYNVYCSSCHGPDGHGGKASSIVDGSYLALVSDQYLRTIVIVGRPELGAPDWRGDLPGKPMSSDDVSDVVAWLSAQRPQISAQVLGGTR